MFERRKYERFQLAMDAVCPRTADQNKIKVDNISQEGLAITSDRSVSPGVEVELEILIPGGTCPVVAKGQIVWINDHEIEGHSEYKIGVKLRDKDQGWLFGCLREKWMRFKSS